MELRVGHLRQKGRGNDVAQSVQGIDPAQASDALIARGAGAGCSSRGDTRLWQERQDPQQHRQPRGGVHQPQGGGSLAQQIRAQGQQTCQKNPQTGSGEDQGSEPRTTGRCREGLAQGGNHHQHPGAGHAGAEAQQQVRPETIGPERRQGQQHAQPQSAEQASAHLWRTPGKHGIHCADEITEVVGGGNQPGGSQVDLAFAEQVRQLWCQGKTADAHGHHQGNEAGG
ncbi:hypothetical protein D9M71_193600 [compost metagenome]